MRIGTNHGSLSDRIMNRYGDTPLGMVESALEFARIARELDYHAFIFSMKSSNPKVMIEAYRLLVARLREEGPDWNYPIHLGVTEAGEGEDGRIKSAIGIGSLLCDGIGDTIRVSLTEDSVHEIPVAQALAKSTDHARNQTRERRTTGLSFDPFRLSASRRRETIAVGDVPIGWRGNGARGHPPAKLSTRSRTRSTGWAITSRSSFTKTSDVVGNRSARRRGARAAEREAPSRDWSRSRTISICRSSPPFGCSPRNWSRAIRFC